MRRVPAAVLISGRGSNLAALLAAAEAPDYPARIALVLSNRPDAEGLAAAQAAEVPTAVVPHGTHASREAFDAAMDAHLRAAGIELVCLAGFMRVLSDGFVRRWEGRLLNIHPSLLPAFRGLKAHEQAIAAGVRVSGCTVHFVTPELDAGPVVAQAAVPVRAGDDAARLAARTLRAEHALYPHALALVASGAVRYANGRAETAGPAAQALFFPDS